MYSVPPTMFPSSFDFTVIPKVWNKVKFGSAFLYSGIIIVGSVAMDVSLNGLAGFVLSKVKPKGSAILDTLIFWIMMMPSMGIVTGYMNMIDFTPLHLNLTGTFWPMWLGAGVSAFNIFLFRNTFNSISSAYYEAARIDGCSSLGAFFKIFIPLGKPTFMVAIIANIMGSWGNYMSPLLYLNGTEMIPVALKLFKLTSFGLMKNEEFMVLTIAIIVPVALFAIFSRQIMGGADSSGVKG
jgi:multiple sugar transport system permease protein